RIHRGAGTQTAFGPVGVLRERPLQRRRVFARPEASAREGGANRGGTARTSRPLSPGGQRAFLIPVPDFTNGQKERQIMQIYEELKARGLIAQVTDEEEIRELVNNGKATFYIGFDPTADSLHVGHFMALCLMKRLQMAGNRPIALIGGGTGYIGDPSGRTDMRSMMTPETIQHNCDCFKKQMERFIEFGEGKALMLNNADWLLKLNYIELLR
ncbi:Regulator of chromosome condensation (RCC1) repeat, partial [Dysosmobacter welbionis]